MPGEFGPLLEKLRKDRGLSREELAEASGRSASTIGHLERGIRGPSQDMIEDLAKGLGATPEECERLYAARKTDRGGTRASVTERRFEALEADVAEMKVTMARLLEQGRRRSSEG